MQSIHKRQALIAVIGITVGLAHFVIGPDYAGPARRFVTSYVMDLLIPFSSYFLLSASEGDVSFLQPCWRKVLLVFAVISSAEIAQAFGYRVFGTTFDPGDLIAYAAGAVAAAVVDKMILSRFDFWRAI